MWRSITRCGCAAAVLPPPPTPPSQAPQAPAPTAAATAAQRTIAPPPRPVCARGLSAVGHARRVLPPRRMHAEGRGAVSAVSYAALTAQHSAHHTAPSDGAADRSAAAAPNESGGEEEQAKRHEQRLTRRGRPAKRAAATPTSAAADEGDVSAAPSSTKQSSDGGRAGVGAAAAVSRPTSARFQQPTAHSTPEATHTTIAEPDVVAWRRDLLLTERLVPNGPTVENATKDSILSHLLTMRRSISAYRNGTRSYYVLSRSITFFMEEQVPMLMTQPPVPASLLHLVEAGQPPHSLALPTAPQPRSPHPRGYFKKHGVSPKALFTLQRSGSGALAWSVEIAEALLLTSEKLNTGPGRLWCCRAALLFLAAQEEAQAAATARPPPLTAEQRSDKAQLAVALLRLLSRERVRSTNASRVLGPHAASLVARAALSCWGWEAARNAGRTSGPAPLLASGPTKPSKDPTQATSSPPSSPSSSTAAAVAASAAWALEDSFSVEDCVADYLGKTLLPQILEELRRFCEAVERDYDAEPKRAAPQVLNSVELEGFSSLCAVMGRSIGFGCVRRRGDAITFDVGHTAAATRAPLPAQPALSSRAFAITLSVIAAQMNGSAGPQSGELEKVLGRSWQMMRMFPVSNRAVSPLSVGAVRRTGGDSGDGGGGSAAARKSRFTSSAAAPAASTKPTAGGGGSRRSVSSSSSRSGRRSESPSTPTSAPCAGDPAAVLSRFGNFNLAHVIPVLQLSYTGHAFDLLLSRPTSAEATAATAERIADAVASLTLLAVHWAPVCRSHQLPSVVGLYTAAVASHGTRKAAPRRGGTAAEVTVAAAAAHDEDERVEAMKRVDVAEATPPGSSLDAAVLVRVREKVLPLAGGGDAAWADQQVTQQLCRLSTAAHNYMERLHSSAFYSVLASMCRVLTYWPRVAAPAGDGAGAIAGGGTYDTDSSGWTRRSTAAVVFDAPPEWGVPVVLQLSRLVAEWWMRLRGRGAWDMISRAAHRGKHADYYERAAVSTPGEALCPNASSLSFASVSTLARLPAIAAQLRKRASSAAEAEWVMTELLKYGAGVTDSPVRGFRVELFAPFFMLRQNRIRASQGDRAATPAEMLAMTEMTQALASYLAVPTAAGAGSFLALELAQYLRTDHMATFMSGTELYALQAVLMNLLTIRVTVPEVLALCGSIDASLQTGAASRQGVSWLQGRGRRYAAPAVELAMRASLERHTLYLLDATGKSTVPPVYCDGASLLQWCAYRSGGLADGGDSGAAAQTAAALRHYSLHRFDRKNQMVDPVTSREAAWTAPDSQRFDSPAVAPNLESAYERLCHGHSTPTPVAWLLPYFRATVTMCEAETDAAAGQAQESLSSSFYDLVIRASFHVLFAPAPTAQTAGSASLETLLTLHLVLACSVHQRSLYMRLNGLITPGRAAREVHTTADVRTPTSSTTSTSLPGAPPSVAVSVSGASATVLWSLCRTTDALRARLVSAATSHEVVSDDLRTLLELSIQAEGLLPPPVDVTAEPVRPQADASLAELVHRRLYTELQRALAATSLHALAGELSRLHWWVARRAHASSTASDASAAPSWVEAVVLDTIATLRRRQRDAEEMQKAEEARGAGAVPSHARTQAATRRFHVYEWTLLPFYAKLAARRVSVGAAPPAAAAAPATTASAALFDDFTAMEDSFAEGASGAFASGGGTDAAGAAAAAAPLSAADAEAATTLEAALHALPTQATSVDVLLHVLRQVFLSFPVLLSTAPDAASYFGPRRGDGHRPKAAVSAQQAWATLPVALTELPAGLRERYVATLYRLFSQAMRDNTCDANELAEWLHLCWLADPRSSSVAASEARRAAHASWPSLHDRCSAYLQSALEAAAGLEMERHSGEAGAAAAGAASAQATSTPRSEPVPLLLTLICRCQKSGLLGSIAFEPRDGHWATVAAAALHPNMALLLLHSLCSLRRVEAQWEVRQRRVCAAAVTAATPPSTSSSRAPASLSLLPASSMTLRSSARERALAAFRPLVVYTVTTVETLLDTSKSSVLPLILAMASELDPQLALDLIQCGFALPSHGDEHQHGVDRSQTSRRSGARRGGSGDRDGAVGWRRYNSAMGRTNVAMTKELVLGNGFSAAIDRSSRGRQRQAELAASTIMALLLVSSYRQASSAVWAAPGGGGGSIGGGGVDRAGDAPVAGDDRDAVSERSLDVAEAAQAQVLGASYNRGVRYLRGVLLQQMFGSRVPRLLSHLPASAVVQLLQLSVVEESPRLLRLVEWLLLSLMPQPWPHVGAHARRKLEQVLTPVWRGGGGGGGGFAKAAWASAAEMPNTSEWRRANKSDPNTLAAELALSRSDLKTKVVVTAVLTQVRLPLSAEGFQLLRRLPLHAWRSIMHREMVWPPYRGYALTVIQRRKASMGSELDGQRRPGEIKDPISHWWDSVRCSLANMLVTFDDASVRYLAAAGMGPLQTLDVTSELLWGVAVGVQCLRNNTTLLRDTTAVMQSHSRFGNTSSRLYTAQMVDMPAQPGDDARSAAAEDDEDDGVDASTAPPLTSYEVLRRYASPDSVLRTRGLQSWLRVACEVVDELASTRHADFIATLSREARWRHQVANAPRDPRALADEGPMGTSSLSAVEAAAAAAAAAKTADRNESGVSSMEGDAAATLPLVLDWRPIVRFICVLRRLDPGMVARQERVEWWRWQAPDSASATPAVVAAAWLSQPHGRAARALEVACPRSGGDAADGPRDVLHGALDAILRNAHAHWQLPAADGDAAAPATRSLTMMNLGDVPRAYAELAGDTGVTAAVRADAARQDTEDEEGDCVDVGSWLTGGTLTTTDEAPVSGVALTQGGLARSIPEAGVPLLSTFGGTQASVFEEARLHRRTSALRRVGVLRSARGVAARARAYGLPCAASLAGSARTAEEDATGRRSHSGGGAAGFWIGKTRALEDAILQCIFEPATASSSASTQASAAPAEDALSTRERHARSRVQLLRCNDLAWLLLQLTRDTSAEALARYELETRIVMDTLVEMLPSASRRELVRVVRALLKLCLSWSATESAAPPRLPAAPSALQDLIREARRVLANTAVLIANDVERFTHAEVLWLVSRLHTPRVRAVRAADAAMARRIGTTEASSPSQAPLDVSLSLMSAASARALIDALLPLTDSGSVGWAAVADNAGADVDDDDNNDDAAAAAAGAADDAAAFSMLAALRGASVAEDDSDEAAAGTATATTAGPVTVQTWLDTVQEAERLRSATGLVKVLRLIERTAV